VDLAINQTGLGNRWSLATGIASFGLRPIHRVVDGRELLCRWRAGCIVTAGSRLEAVRGRWWPHVGNLLQVAWDSRFRGLRPDRCELFYHEPLTAPGFLTLSYVHTGPRTSLSTLYAATLVLDEIARLKGSQAIVCHATNARISDRLFQRWGWQTHCPQWSGRHFIKRFYGVYPDIPTTWRSRLTFD
jgi:hypothetical protein